VEELSSGTDNTPPKSKVAEKVKKPPAKSAKKTNGKGNGKAKQQGGSPPTGPSPQPTGTPAQAPKKVKRKQQNPKTSHKKRDFAETVPTDHSSSFWCGGCHDASSDGVRDRPERAANNRECLSVSCVQRWNASVFDDYAKRWYGGGVLSVPHVRQDQHKSVRVDRSGNKGPCVGG